MSEMQVLSIIVGAIISGSGAYYGSYLQTKGEQKALAENLEKVTAKVESIRLLHQKALTEHDIKLENFRKVIELRISAFDKAASLRTYIWNLFTFKIGTPSEVSKKFQELSTYLNTYIALLSDCDSEIKNYSLELSKIDSSEPVSSEALEPVFKALEQLMSKLIYYKNIELCN